MCLKKNSRKRSSSADKLRRQTIKDTLVYYDENSVNNWEAMQIKEQFSHYWDYFVKLVNWLWATKLENFPRWVDLRKWLSPRDIWSSWARIYRNPPPWDLSILSNHIGRTWYFSNAPFSLVWSTESPCRWWRGGRTRGCPRRHGGSGTGPRQRLWR